MITKLKEVDDFFFSLVSGYPPIFDFPDLEKVSADLWRTRMNIFGPYL